MKFDDGIFGLYSRLYENRHVPTIHLSYAGAAERMLRAIGEPVTVKAGNEISPVFESPLGQFDPSTLGPKLEKYYGISIRRLTRTDRWLEFRGDVTAITSV